MLTSLGLLFVLLSFVHQAISLHCLVVRPGHGIISEECPRLAVACRVRIEKNSIEWYPNKLYDRNRFACVLPSEYDGSAKRSGCMRKRSGAERCWCYGQSDCNNAEIIRKLYKAFKKGDAEELERVIDDIETADIPDYTYAEPTLNIKEAIYEDSEEEQSTSAAHQKPPSAVQNPRRHGDDHPSGRAQPRTTKKPKNPEKIAAKSAQKSSKRPQKPNRRTTTTTVAPSRPPPQMVQNPAEKPAVETPHGDEVSDALTERNEGNPKNPRFYAEPDDDEDRDSANDREKSNQLKERSSEEQKRHETMKLPKHKDRGIAARATVKNTAAKNVESSLSASLLAFAISVIVL